MREFIKSIDEGDAGNHFKGLGMTETFFDKAPVCLKKLNKKLIYTPGVNPNNLNVLLEIKEKCLSALNGGCENCECFLKEAKKTE